MVHRERAKKPTYIYSQVNCRSIGSRIKRPDLTSGVFLYLNMEQNQGTLKEHLKNQSLLVALAIRKLAVAEFLHTSTDAILCRNEFLDNTAHIYYQSAVIDVAKLVGENEKTHQYTLSTLLNKPELKKELSEEDVSRIDAIITAISEKKEVVMTLRDKFYAHNDFPNGHGIPYSLGAIETVKEVASECKRALEIACEIISNVEDEIMPIKELLSWKIKHDPFINGQF